MTSKGRHQSHERTKPRYLVGALVLLVVSMLIAITFLTVYKSRIPSSASLESRVGSVSPLQDPNQAENYRRLAAAKRKAAERVPEKRQCYEAWAKYYDCLADRAEYGDGRACPAEPQC